MSQAVVQYAEVGIVTQNVTSLSVTPLLKKVTSLPVTPLLRYSVTPLQKVTEVTVTPLLRYFYKIVTETP